jgi:hypothetical protein
MSYFRGDVGALQWSSGEWTEFYVPLASLRMERGPARALRSAQLGPGDLIQFLCSVDSLRNQEQGINREIIYWRKPRREATWRSSNLEYT